MGTTPQISIRGSPIQEKELMEKLIYIENSNVSHIGESQIYRFKEPPYDYLVKHVKVFNEEDAKLPAYKETVTKAAEMKYHKNISQIHYYKIESRNGMCLKSSSIETYSNYYAITLKEIIQQRKKDDIRFTPSETWYVLKNLVQVSTFLRQNEFYFGGYKPSCINLSAEGYIKLYILHVFQDSKKKSSPYYEALEDRRNISKYLPLPPEYLPKLRNGESENIETDPEKQDSFYIGMVIMEMLIDEDIRKYFSLNQETLCSFKKDTLQQDIDLLRHVYGDQLMDLVQMLLHENQVRRITPREAMETIIKIRDDISMSGALRMFEDDSNQIKPKLSYRTSLQINYGLKVVDQNLIENKLTAGPIQTFTKRTNNNRTVCGVSLTSSKQSIASNEMSFTKDKSQSVRSSSLKSRPKDRKIRMPR